jgi:hypothetical protein
VFRTLFESFGAECARKIAGLQPLDDDECCAFTVYLDARSLAGHRFLGTLAGEDGDIDTVTGRCGLPPSLIRGR